MVESAGVVEIDKDIAELQTLLASATRDRVKLCVEKELKAVEIIKGQLQRDAKRKEEVAAAAEEFKKGDDLVYTTIDRFGWE